MTGPAAGLVDGRLNSSPQGVDCTTYRSTKVVGGGGYERDGWVESIAALRIALAEVTVDEDKFRLQGREVDADFRAVVTAGLDVLEGDGILIAPGAPHHAGLQFVVLAAREPEGAYRRLYLKEQPELDFTQGP
jgi:hypothetical protein